MTNCPYCDKPLEEVTEITGYHYFLCKNPACKISYKYDNTKVADASLWQAGEDLPTGVQPLDPGAEKLGIDTDRKKL